ncbi:aminoglycoside/choline kinase family phosphotransferase [Allocatelliglobosispora scoriae]|uniref:Aminoglycoside/choline kinase family phosphotransferase n=1 Tax=Allocatelliglobosispora scoriae TaxID=643052 RepID=A0A841BM86_9ACTN|nr:aminoglycoside phosphotransferase family protein [Allocatelliglobosispora scoriae]MBB5869384.1 aminoglycoside/choline kinase family phosphotransferase [Allocatelliglobosispora scoriae]
MSVEIEVIVPTPDGAVLARPSGGGYTLPLLRIDADWAPTNAAMPRALAAETGVDSFLLEPLDETAFVLTPVGRVAPLDGYAWVDADKVDHPGLRNWLARPDDDRRPAWFRAGWLETAVTWIDEALAVRDLVRIGPVEQVQHWSMSCVLRVPVPQGFLFFKAVLPHLAHEPQVISRIAAIRPGSAPQVLAHDAAQGWWLAADFGGTAGSLLDPATRTGALVALADLQQATIDIVDELDCPVVTLDDLAARVPALMRRADLWAFPGRAAPVGATLSTEERLRWAEFGLRLQDQCAELADLDLPLTLTHGDFHIDNVARTDDGFVLYDWSFAAVSHPFFDLASWLHQETEESAAQHVKVYLDRWRGHGSPTALRSAWQATRPVAALAELLKFVDLADRVGPDYEFQYLPMAYAWVRRLLTTWGPR